jgi:dienelactone hydrolase
VSYLKYLVIILVSSFVLASTEVLEFKSANPFSFKDIITNLDNQEEQVVTGILTIPENVTGKIPLVIGVAGSSGWGSHHFEYLKMYQDMGIATFQLQSFKSRGETSTVGTQNTVTHAMIILDSYRALEKLSENPLIDIDNVAITGWSLGGGVTLFSGWKPLMDAIDSNYKFAAHLAFYPPCFVEPSILDFTDSPIHILIGEIDEWTPSEPCLELVSLLDDNGADIDITVYEGAHHSFDRDGEVIIAEGGYSFTDCNFSIEFIYYSCLILA